MWDWLALPAVQVVLAVTVTGGAIYAGWQVALALRPSTNKADTSVEGLSQNFEEMRLGGDISDEELRNIKAVLGKTQRRQPTDFAADPSPRGE